MKHYFFLVLNNRTYESYYKHDYANSISDIVRYRLDSNERIIKWWTVTDTDTPTIDEADTETVDNEFMNRHNLTPRQKAWITDIIHGKKPGTETANIRVIFV